MIRRISTIMIAASMVLMASLTAWSINSKPALDRTGTTGGYQQNRGPQVHSNSALACLGSFEAERSGFDEGQSLTRAPGNI
jgi:hypothetical protein